MALRNATTYLRFFSPANLDVSRKTVTSSGCVKCIEFGTRVINMLFWRQASTTAFEKCKPKLLPIKATGPFKAHAFGKKNLKNRPPSIQLPYTLCAQYTTIGGKYVLSALPQNTTLIDCFEWSIFFSTRFLPHLTITWFIENRYLLSHLTRIAEYLPENMQHISTDAFRLSLPKLE